MTIEWLAAHEKDLGGGFTVRRLLPSLRRQAVGPFLFFDHFGPLVAQPADQHDVRPHPHIGLATVTYLFDGAMQHHDSTGAFQRIEPGAVNWMTAGRGIVHSERRPVDLQQRAYSLHGLQLWVAAPESHEAIEPSFQHVGADRIPSAMIGGGAVRLLVGRAHGLQSPVQAMSPTLFVDYLLEPGARLDLPGADAALERALYAVQGQPRLQTAGADALALPPHRLAVLPDAGTVQLQAGDAPARVVLVGGAPVGHRHIWWNFVASRPELIEQAAEAWLQDALGQVPGETERIPLPAVRWRRGA